jgi:hypothetical protein
MKAREKRAYIRMVNWRDQEMLGRKGNPEPVGGEFIAVNESSVFAQARNNQVHAYDFDGLPVQGYMNWDSKSQGCGIQQIPGGYQ